MRKHEGIVADVERRLDALRREIQVGLDEIDRGECDEHDEHSLKSFFDEVRIEGRGSFDTERDAKR